MVRELDKKSIPTVHMVNMVPVALDIGSNRIVQTVAIPYPLGNPALSKEEQHELRYGLVEKALSALTDEIDEQTIFD